MPTERIPKEIMEEARRIAWKMPGNLMWPDRTMTKTTNTIARALMARDKRAADKAYDEAAKCNEKSASARIAGDKLAVYRHNTAFHSAANIATAILTYDGGRDAG